MYTSVWLGHSVCSIATAPQRRTVCCSGSTLICRAPVQEKEDLEDLSLGTRRLSCGFAPNQTRKGVCKDMMFEVTAAGNCVMLHAVLDNGVHALCKRLKPLAETGLPPNT